MEKVKATNIEWQAGLLDQGERWKALSANGCTVWFTGLPASGKSTIASMLERDLVLRGIHAYRLDGDNIRHGLNKDLGFSREDRAENIRRIGEVSKLLAHSGCIALTAFISPYIIDRENARRLHNRFETPFLEVFVDAPPEVCEQRDPKGQYKKARLGLIRDFTGINDSYEPPGKPELVLKTAELSAEECVEECLKMLAKYNMIS